MSAPQQGRGRGRGASLEVILGSQGSAQSLSGPNSNGKLSSKSKSHPKASTKSKIPTSASSNAQPKCVDTVVSGQFEDSHGKESGDFNYDDVLKKVTASYLVEDSDEQSTNLGQTREIFNSMVDTEANVCLICLDNIERRDQIWNCGHCFCMLHMTCIQQWISEGAYRQKLSTLSDQHFPNKRPPWNCPKCRNEYPPSDNPSVYKCFCTKVANPPDDPWVTPHSCGDACNRPLRPECGHRCLLLCHPGPCPPCPKSVRVACYCGQQPAAIRRCAARSWSCSQRCNKLLPCGQHTCAQLCHPGDCQPCPERSVQSCRCGAKRQTRPCAEPIWSCDKVCGRLLSCGNHRCSAVCHPLSECGTCERASRTRSCPCGKVSVANVPCTEDVPCCGDTCGKPLSCQAHTCMEKCHTGPCAQCLQMSVKTCKCGAKQKELPCAKSFTCDTRCTKMKSCGRHQCRRRCCDGLSCPECDQPCGRKLNCGNHKCSTTCHDGKCYPCPVTVTKSCPCGQTSISVACIRQKTAQPPKCRVPCRKPSLCDHPSIQRHYCHSGECPPCSLPCGKTLAACGHACGSACHDAVRCRIKETKQVSGPWEQQPTHHTEIIRESCPPCPVPTPVMCRGGHETCDLPCSDARVYSCGRRCGRALACTNHTCEFICHQVTGSPDKKAAGAECQTCEAGCSKPRPPGCSHECLRPCHPGDCPRCKQMIKTRCHCGVTVLHFPCHEWTSKDFNKDDKLKCPGECPKLLACGHQCSLTCHPGECAAECNKKVTVRCPCKSRKESFACHAAADAVVKCSEACREKQALKEEEQEAAAAAAPDDVAADLHMLPGRRQRRRKEKPSDEERPDQTLIPWPLVRKYIPRILAVLALVLAFYWALTAEN